MEVRMAEWSTAPDSSRGLVALCGSRVFWSPNGGVGWIVFQNVKMLKVDFFLVRSTDFLCAETVSAVRICARAQLRGNIAQEGTDMGWIDAFLNQYTSSQGRRPHPATIWSGDKARVLLSWC
ncbi:unnamed protein product [Clavelina lepadiformis]|uniref:Uncharacterized protein n=1 Tax=Clavelina lepadiformis TaxID=159417 RepID=A0ABP0F7T8_CLALP